MTTLETLARDCETAPSWNLSARASDSWTWTMYGDGFKETAQQVCSASRCLQLASEEFANLKDQGCTKLEVVRDRDGLLVHTFE